MGKEMPAFTQADWKKRDGERERERVCVCVCEK
jgi:hypothetical protein